MKRDKNETRIFPKAVSRLSVKLILGVMVFASVLLMVFDAKAEEAYWKGDTSRYFWFNDGSCPTGGRQIWRETMQMWTFYAVPRLYEIENHTDKKESEDPEDRVWCESVNEMAENYGEDVLGIATSNGWEDEKSIHRTNIAIRYDQFTKPCTLLHEFGHSLGLSMDEHDPDPVAVMYAYALEPGYHDTRKREDCKQNFLMASDLINVAKSYSAPANCTPYIQPDWSVYFPNIAGREAEFIHLGNGEWQLLWFAKTALHEWDCELIWQYRPYSNDFYISADLYDNGEIRRKSFVLNGATLKGF